MNIINNITDMQKNNNGANQDLTRFPPPPSGEKAEWPWADKVESIPVADDAKHDWPCISIVTPSLNQGQFIEETIRSVLLQGYPNLEYIIIDGGSTDDSLAVIKKYEKWLTHWVSEPDRGQAHAINKGFKKAGGDIRAYINSDDLYEPGALFAAATIFVNHPETQLVAGQCVVFDENREKRIFEPWWPQSLDYYVSKTYSSTFAQPAAFWGRKIHKDINGFDETLHYCFDREFFLRMGLAGVVPRLLKERLARFREHTDSKTVGQGAGFHRDSLTILKKHADACGLSGYNRQQIARRIQMELDYIDVFETWQNRGRWAAIKTFASLLRRYPTALKQRKILGQARRLLMVKANHVKELGTE